MLVKFRNLSVGHDLTFGAERVSTLSRLPPKVVQAGNLLSDGDLSAAENILRAYLLKSGDDVEA